MNPIERLKVLVSELAAVYNGTSLGNALSYWKDVLTKEGAYRNLYVVEPVGSARIITDFEDDAKIVEGLEWYQCPRCGLVFNVRGGEPLCPNCRIPAVPMFVGVPKPSAPVQPYTGGGGTDTSLISSVVTNRGTSQLFNCPMRRGERRNSELKSRGLKPTDPNRPMMSLRFVCHVEAVRRGGGRCEFYDPNGHFCNHSNRIFFTFSSKLRGVFIVPVRPSEELTKPFIVTIHSIETGKVDDLLLREFKEIIKYPDLIEEVKYGGVRVWELQLFYTVGPPTVSKANRFPVIYANVDAVIGDQYRIPGRKLGTQGLYLRLNFDVLSQIAGELSSRANSRYDEFVVTHSLSHVLLNAVINTAGVSEEEVSESIFFSREHRIAEIVIYDNAEGGIDGVGAAVRSFPDLVRRVFYSAKECPRRCRDACRACLFSTSCTYANTKLSWYVANMLLDWSKKNTYTSLG